MDLIYPALLAVATAYIIWRTTTDRSRLRARSLRAASSGLRRMGAALHDGERVEGTHEGFSYALTLSLRKQRGGDECFTECRIDLPLNEVAFHLEPSDGAPKDVVASPTGDASFDERFVVEAAPHGLAARVLTAPIRKRLLDLRTVQVDWCERRACLKLTWPEWGDHEADARRIVLAGVLLARNLALEEERSQQLDTPQRASAGGYRTVVERRRQTEERGADALAAREVVALRQRRSHRRVTQGLGTVVVGLLMVLAYVVTFWLID